MSRVSEYISRCYRQLSMLEGYKRYEWERFVMAIDDAKAEAVAVVANLDSDIGLLNKKDQLALAVLLAGKIKPILQDSVDRFIGNLESLTETSWRIEFASLKKAVPEWDWVTPKKPLWPTVVNTPVSGSGNLIVPFGKQWGDGETQRIVKIFRKAWTNSGTNADLIKQLRGSRQLRLKDSVFESTRRNARLLIGEGAQHAAEQAKNQLWLMNGFEKYIWISVLDSATSPICRKLSNRIFPVGGGPLPPAHYNCRSGTRLLLPDEDPENPEAGLSYYEWLREQDNEFQDEVLGQARGKLFRDSKLTNTEFADLTVDSNFRALTLDQMRKLNPDAFDEAGMPF